MSEKKDKWEMPQAVFKSSEGSIPKSLEETISQSFIANADTLEIDEDDDILGIMDPALISQPTQHAADRGEEDILETEPAAAASPGGDAASEAEAVATAEAAGINDDSPKAATDNEEPQPMAVTEDEAPDKVGAASAGSQSNSLTYILIAVIAAAVVGLFYYLSQSK